MNFGMRTWILTLVSTGCNPPPALSSSFPRTAWECIPGAPRRVFGFARRTSRTVPLARSRVRGGLVSPPCCAKQRAGFEHYPSTQSDCRQSLAISGIPRLLIARRQYGARCAPAAFPRGAWERAVRWCLPRNAGYT